jgi:sulfur relay protein TusC/DsrF
MLSEVLVVINKQPYGSSIAIEAFRMIYGLEAAGIKTSILFMGDGVFVLTKNQDPKGIGGRNPQIFLSQIAKFKVKIFAMGESLVERGLDRSRLIENVTILTKTEAADLISKHKSTVVL